MFSRDDTDAVYMCVSLCCDDPQLEPAASSVLLRLLVRYLVELEALDVTLFTKSQAHCFASTVDVRGFT